MAFSASIEDYLKAIHALEQDAGSAATGRLAERLGIAPASVSGMIKKLTARGLIRHRPYQGVNLTAAGRNEALRVIRRHRLIETFLVRIMGLPVEQVHDEADRWEHAVSAAMEDRMAELLGDPQVDPHGEPIPERRPAAKGGEETA